MTPARTTTNSTRFEVREAPDSALAGALAEIETRGGIVARRERVRSRNGVWRLRVRWPNAQRKVA